ncbi:MazG-like nucleotide pyrophosphohydrolase [Arthrobacter phage Rizwana]|nr:MazG-like nucleotide pyrophosphohydrolase [Arthrobacter phage Rizwana]
MSNKVAALQQRGIDKLIELGFQDHIEASGGNSAAKGFHADWPVEPYPTVTETGEPAAHVTPEEVEAYKASVRRAIAEKLALVHEEISEALGEIRSGGDPLETYFSLTEKTRAADGRVIGETTTLHPGQGYDGDGKPLLKPEGFLVELADAVIRIHDLVYLLGADKEYIEADRLKREYNSTRPYKHGRKF